MGESVVVAFSGQGCGTGPLTWGQREIWAPMELAGTSMTIGGATPLPPGVTVEAIARSLRFAMGRHQSLRTRFRLDERGVPCEQVLSAAGEIELVVVDATDEEDPGEVAERLAEEYDRVDFDYETEWPVRMAVVRHRGAPTHMVAVYLHLTVDAHGMFALMADMTTMDPETGEPTAPVLGAQPLEQAESQTTRAHRRRSDQALALWDRQLRAIPAQRFAPADRPCSPRYRSCRHDSPALLHATQAAAARLRVDTSPVLLAGYAVALARVTGVDPSVIQVVVSNRFRPGLAETVSAVNQTGLVVVELGDAGFDEVVGRTWQALMTAYKHAYYDSAGRNALIAGIRAERGGVLDVSCLFNDRRRPGRWVAPETPATEAEVRDLLPRSAFHWIGERDSPTERCFLHLDDEADHAAFQIDFDTLHLPPDRARELARHVESAVVTGAYHPTTPIVAHRD